MISETKVRRVSIQLENGIFVFVFIHFLDHQAGGGWATSFLIRNKSGLSFADRSLPMRSVKLPVG